MDKENYTIQNTVGDAVYAESNDYIQGKSYEVLNVPAETAPAQEDVLTDRVGQLIEHFSQRACDHGLKLEEAHPVVKRFIERHMLYLAAREASGEIELNLSSSGEAMTPNQDYQL